MFQPAISQKGLDGRQVGGITILVTLLLLVLMTITAFAMSKNALREVIITGTSRQGAQVRNIADTGLEWSIYWMMDDQNNLRPTPAVDSGAQALRDQKSTLVASMQAGVTTDAITNADMTLSGAGANPTQRFELFLTYMGNHKQKFSGSEVHASSITAASPAEVQLWSVRSDGYLEYTSGPTFLHRREAWFTIPPGAQK